MIDSSGPAVPISTTLQAFLARAERYYAGLIAEVVTPGSAPDEDPGLGGQLLYAGQLDTHGRRLIVAANIAGAATLAATVDEAVQKQAFRDGVVDFLVTSLDEALRILKNQLRKRETVAVCVAQAPETVQLGMLERGVLPDLLRPTDESSPNSPFVVQGARQILIPTLDENSALLTWRVAASPAQWLPRLDAIALECVPPENWPARRWLRLAPRYLGRLAQGTRLLSCDRAIAADFIERVRGLVESGVIAIPVEMQLRVPGPQPERSFRFEKS
ncbi:MAG: hypothetical protein ABSG51_00945 [Terracidiphilus sp.]|jgi:hypothetical protein